MAIVQGTGSVRGPYYLDKELEIESGSTATVGGGADPSAVLTVTPHKTYKVIIVITALGAAGNDAQVVFSIRKSSDATMAAYQQLVETINQDAATSTTGTAIADEDLPLEVVNVDIPMGDFKYLLVNALATKTGATCTWNARAIPMD